MVIAKLKEQYDADQQENWDMGKMVNEWHCGRLEKAINECRDKVIYGGKVNTKARYVEPTIIDSPSLDAECMKDEIFGPILPVISFKTFDDAIKLIKQIEKPLVVYYFGSTWGNADRDRLIYETSSGAFV